jgi:hypothetical protein
MARWVFFVEDFVVNGGVRADVLNKAEYIFASYLKS